MDTKFKVSFHFKDEWEDSKSGKLVDSEVSTETMYANSQEELSEIITKIHKQYEGRNWGEHDGIIHSRTLLDTDTFSTDTNEKLSKEEMFDFILKNDVQLTLSNTLWQKTDGTKVRLKYAVSINDHNMCGMDLEEAIQYYHKNHTRKK